MEDYTVHSHVCAECGVEADCADAWCEPDYQYVICSPCLEKWQEPR